MCAPAGPMAQGARTLPRQLDIEYSRGFSEENLRHIQRFAEAFPDNAIVSAVRRQLGWTRFRPLSKTSHVSTEEVVRHNARIAQTSASDSELPIHPQMGAHA